jgi:hypothetical protein
LFHHTKNRANLPTQILEQDSSDLTFTSSVGPGYIYTFKAAFCLSVLENLAVALLSTGQGGTWRPEILVVLYVLYISVEYGGKIRINIKF